MNVNCRPLLSVLGIAALSLLGGFVNGLLGTGGGILLLFLLRLCAKGQGARFFPADEENGKNAFAAVLLCILPLSFFTVFLYDSEGYFAKLSFSSLLPYLLGAVPGGMLGAWLLDRLKLPVVEGLFAALLLFSGIQMVL